MSSYGISNLYYGFVMLDKYDPNQRIMPIGAFRIFKDQDGWSEPTSWRVRQMITEPTEVKGTSLFDLSRFAVNR